MLAKILSAVGVMPLLVLSLVLVGAVTFGAISLTTNLWTAVSIGIIVVAAGVLLSRRGSPSVAFVVGAVGMGMFFFAQAAPTFTIGQAASLVGVGP